MKRILSVYAALSVCGYASGQDAADKPKLSDEIVFLAQGIESAATQVGQTRGRARFEEVIADNPPDVKHYDFMTDGDKFRFDTFVEPPNEADKIRPVSKYSSDGEAVYTYHFAADGSPSPRAHIRPLEVKLPVHRGTWSGISFHPQGLYIPQDLMGVRPLLGYLERTVKEGNEVLVEGSLASAPQVVLVINKKNKADKLTMRLTVDVANGFTLPLVEYLANGNTVSKAIRKYERCPSGNGMLLTEYTADYEGKHAKKRTHVTVDYKECGVSQDPKVFTVAGFELPVETTIQDTRYGDEGIKFRLGGPDQIMDGLDMKLSKTAIPAAEIKSVVASAAATETVAQARPVSVAEVKEEKPDTSKGGMWLLGALAGLGVIISGFIYVRKMGRAS